MSRKHPSGAVQKHVQRQGEGYFVDLMVVGDSDASTTSQIDMSALPVPDRRFSADAAAIQLDQSMVKLLFGQRQPIGGGLLSLVVISMAFEAVHRFVDSADEEFERNFEEFSKQLPRESLTDFTTKADQTVILNSSLVMAGYHGSSACLDFYFTSPFAMRQVAIFRKIAVEPIVRINLPSTLLFAMLKGLRECVEAPTFPLPKKAVLT